MSDSPFCPLCMTHNQILSNTYKVAGKSVYRCGTCKNLIPSDQFDAEDFQWKDHPDQWKANLVTKGIKPEILERKNVTV